MNKIIGSILLLGLLVMVLVLSTPVTRLGSGFIIGDARNVITYFDLVKEAKGIRVKFPNEDDINAKLVYKDPTINLAILELDEAPKVKREPLSFSEPGISMQDNTVFTLGYPWTNTLEDRHTYIEGFLANKEVNFSDLIPIDLSLDPVHSGSPLMNRKRQVVGMVLVARHAADYYPAEPSGKYNFAIPAETLNLALQSLKPFKNVKPVQPKENVSMEAFIESVRNNVVLIEAR
jgi:S1-C subfamily serine protease